MSMNKVGREILIQEMARLGNQGINCQGCKGLCCTSMANSMQITKDEAKDILSFLKSNGRFNTDVKNKLLKCIEEFRLDYEIPTTRGIPFRRTYTCPFYEPGPKGCTIDLEYKPLGCLGFNPKEINAKGGASCSSNTEILKQISMDKTDKKNIPKALLDIWDQI